MTKKKGDLPSNVKPIFKGVEVDLEDAPPEPVLIVVEECKKLLKMAEAGELQGFIYTGSSEEGKTFMSILGQFHDPFATQASLRYLDDQFYDYLVWPMMVGIDPAEYDE